MPANFKRCVNKIKWENPAGNPYAICRVSTGFRGSTHHKPKCKCGKGKMKGGKF